MSGTILRDAIDSHRNSHSTFEPGAVFHGMSRLVAQPEFSQSNSLRPLLELMDSQPAAVVPMVQSHQGGVLIGSEHPHEALVKCAVVHASYKSSNEGVGHVALVGPMRMAYATAMAAVQCVADHLDRVLS